MTTAATAMETQEPKLTESPINYAQGETKFEVEVGQHAGIPARDRDDDDNLMRLGKKAVLKRNFSFWSLLGFSCSILVTWEGLLVTFLAGFQNGGPAGVFYNYIIVWAGTLASFVTLSELASMAPTSGGQYHWTSILAPRSAYKFYSYLAGWLTVFGWQGSVASAAYLCGTMIQGLAVLTTSYDPIPWQTTLIIWAVLLYTVVINISASWLLPNFERLVLVLHIAGFFAVLIPLARMGQHNSADEVFTTFLNEGGWQTQGLSFFVGISGNIFAFAGSDAAVHMSEEIHNASIMVPRAIITSIILNGILGFAIILATLFSLTDIEGALHSRTNYPFMQIFLQATNSPGGSAAMASIIVVLTISATVGIVASCSRLIWSFARDRGIPGWTILSKVDPRTKIPVLAVAVATIVGALLGLIVIGSTTVFNDVIALSISSLFLSYLICSCLLLYRRCTGAILPASAVETTTLTGAPPSVVLNTVDDSGAVVLVWGPFHVPGIWGILVNIIAIIYLVIGIFFSLWPPTREVTGSTMNYGVVGTGGVIILSTLYYVCYARKVYTGPVVETNRD